MVSSTVFRTARPMMSEVLADGGPRRSKATLQLQVLQLGAKPRYLLQLENLYSRLSASRCGNRSNSPDKLFLKFQRWKKTTWHGTNRPRNVASCRSWTIPRLLEPARRRRALLRSRTTIRRAKFRRALTAVQARAVDFLPTKKDPSRQKEAYLAFPGFNLALSSSIS